jgi:hypothetical protein
LIEPDAFHGTRPGFFPDGGGGEMVFPPQGVGPVQKRPIENRQRLKVPDDGLPFQGCKTEWVVIGHGEEIVPVNGHRMLRMEVAV